ncbi:putative porin [Verrucomicrobiota bacterium sgz303538]
MLIQFLGRLRNKPRLKKPIATLLAAITAGGLNWSDAQAQDAGPLVDALVRKGVLTDKEAEEVRAELKKDFATQTSAGKLKLTDSVKELRLYGDIRLRYQYDNKDPQEDPARPPGFNDVDGGGNPSGSQRSRWRFRLRLNADFKLADNIFGGVELQTGAASDSANQTFENGFSDYPIFISKAYLGWSPTEWLTLTAGKVPNPLYTTELVWDPDINPTGITEQIAFHKLFAGHEVVGYSKDGKSTVSRSVNSVESPWELTLIAGQFIFDDNLEGGGLDPGIRDNDQTTDAYVFHTQLVGSYKFTKDVKLTIAPGWLIYNAASATNLDNNNKFEDSPFVSGATRDINLLLLPGDLSFKIAGIKTKLFWDFSYNIEGRKRVENIYRLMHEADIDGDFDFEQIKNHSSRDDFAFLIGLQLGENKKKGDWSALVSYRRTGLGAVDPNLNDSDFAEGELNMQGFKFGLAYNLTDFAVFGVTYMTAWQIRDIQGGEATQDNAIADSNAVQTLQVDLSVKF